MSAQQLKHSQSAGTLGATGQSILSATGNSAGNRPGSSDGDGTQVQLPKVPAYLSVTGLTRRRKLSQSTGNLHAYLGEDYSQLNWPLPKMYGKEKYGYSLVDVEVKKRAASKDHRFVKECAAMSKKLVRLQYDQQIVDQEWRNTYKLLLQAEHHQRTLPANAQEKTKTLMKANVASHMKYLLELQEQKDMYANAIKETYERCDAIRETIKKEAELDELREFMEDQTQSRIHPDSQFWRMKFNIKSAQH
jgi:hypothetical protein